MVIEDMECLQVMVGVTSLSMHERFTQLAEMTPFQRAAPRRARRLSTNDGPLLSSNLRATNRSQHIVDEVVQQLGLDWRVQELQQDNRSRAGSMPRSRAGSISRYSSASEMPGLVRSNSWGNLSRANSIGNVSQRSGRSGRSNGYQSDHSRAVSFVGPDLNQRLQMRNAWMRRRNMRVRGRGRGRGGYIQRNQYQQHNRWGKNQPLRRQWGWQQWGRQQWGRQQRGRPQGWRPEGTGQQQGWGRLRRWGYAQSEMPSLTPRGRAGQETPDNLSTTYQKRGAVARGRGRGRGGGGRGRGAGKPTAASQNGMPALTTLEQLDKELEEYMAGTPASLDKQLEVYMAQSGLMDTE